MMTIEAAVHKPMRRSLFDVALGVALSYAVAVGFAGEAMAHDDEPETTWLTQVIGTIDGFFPTPWLCTGAAPSPQSILQFHQNWHCSNPDNSGPNWGNRFFGFHKQFVLGFNRYRAVAGFPYVQTWVAAPNALIPPRHGGRLANAPCSTCLALPNTFRLPAAGGTLDSFATVTAIGDAIVGWHNTNHGRIAAAGGTGGCNNNSADMNCPRRAPNDPIFYRYHHIFDDVQNAWRTHQATDIIVVFDRSGSMSLPTSTTGTRLDAARSAATMFADLLEDGSSHRVGLVSFASAATSPPELALTGPATATGAMTSALTPIVAAGSTSIGAGLQAAISTLTGSANPRKAILLLTDGMENTAPFIADVQASLGDTHLCSVGFGTPGSLDGPKLRDLSERQGGIYLSGPDPLVLKKFFVDCFADIFDSFVGADPITTLPPGQAASAPTVHTALDDDKLTFVLSWSHPVQRGALRLAITTPGGNPVDLSDPRVESTFGDTWHIARFKLPFAGESAGKWEARAVRGYRTFVNGFTSDAFADMFAGAELIRQQLRYLCHDGCRNVLYFEDEMPMTDDSTFAEHNSPYAEALFSEVPRGTVRNITRLRDPQQFAILLRKGGFDLLVYVPKIARKEHPYDDLLERVLCAQDAPRAIVSDSRSTAAAQRVLGCVGARRGRDLNWNQVQGDGQLIRGNFKLQRPVHAHDGFSFGLEPIDASAAVAAKNEAGSAAIIAGRSETREAQTLFINALTRASARVVPFNWTSRYYTSERLHPTFHIPEMYWPPSGYDRIKAIVRVTRPLRGLGALAAEAGALEKTSIAGDSVDPRSAVHIRLDRDQTGRVIGSETLEFELFDDGTNGDGTANDHYWEASLPPEVAKVDGEYEFHAVFQMCRAGQCVQREARHKVVVDVKMSPRATTIKVVPEPPAKNRQRARVMLVPRDDNGNPLGPGRIDGMLVSGEGDVKVERIGDQDGRGTYEIVVSWTRAGSVRPQLTISQFGRPQDSIRVPLL